MEGRLERGTLVADSLRLRPKAGFAYVGAFELPLAGLALATRHHFVESTGGAVSRLLVVQLEHWTAETGSYSYELPDPVELGGESYGRWQFELSVAAERRENPGREMERTADFLAAAGLVLPDRHAVARFARIVGPERRREILVFFHECGDDARTEGILERAQGAFTLG
jgi:hypothetical protein